MKMEDENITGNKLLELIGNKRKKYHAKARFPNAILIHPGYYNILKDVKPSENSSNHKKIFDLEIFVTDDVPSFKLIRIYDSHECSI